MSRSFRIHRSILAVALCVACLSQSALADGHFGDATLLVGKERIAGSLDSDSTNKELRFSAKGAVPFRVQMSTIKSLYYERASTPRYAAGLLIAWPLLFTKSKRHYLTIQYTDAAGNGKYQIVQLDKTNFEAALATIEADSGIKIERPKEP